jgi:hypothetical protein
MLLRLAWWISSGFMFLPSWIRLDGNKWLSAPACARADFIADDAYSVLLTSLPPNDTSDPRRRLSHLPGLRLERQAFLDPSVVFGTIRLTALIKVLRDSNVIGIASRCQAALQTCAHPLSNDVRVGLHPLYERSRPPGKEYDQLAATYHARSRYGAGFVFSRRDIARLRRDPRVADVYVDCPPPTSTSTPPEYGQGKLYLLQ